MSSFLAFSRNVATKRQEPYTPTFIRFGEGVRDTIVLQDFNGRSVRIDRSLLTANSLEIEAKEFVRIPDSLYKLWFGRAAANTAKKAKAWSWHLYETNIPLFWKHRKRILAEPRYFHAPMPFSVYLVPGPVRLGILLQAWAERPEIYTRPGKKCGGTMVIYSFAGSPLSGMSSRSYCCVDCGLYALHDTHGHFGSMAFPIRRLTESYAPASEPEPMTLDALVTELSTAAE